MLHEPTIGDRALRLETIQANSHSKGKVCPLCGSYAREVNSGVLFKWTCSTLFRCTNCRSRFLSPLPSREKIERYYKNGRPRHDNSTQYQMAKRQAAWILKNITSESVFRFVEIGCGRGWLVSEMSKQQWCESSVGFDPDAEAVAWARRTLDCDCRQGLATPSVMQDLLAGPQEGETVIAMAHVLEHVTKPTSLIEQLAASGSHWLFVEVPDGEHEGPVLELCCSPADSIGQHFWSFTRRGLECMLHRSGYEIRACEQVGDPRFWRQAKVALGARAKAWQARKRRDRGLRGWAARTRGLIDPTVARVRAEIARALGRATTRMDLPSIRILARSPQKTRVSQ